MLNSESTTLDTSYGATQDEQATSHSTDGNFDYKVVIVDPEVIVTLDQSSDSLITPEVTVPTDKP